MAFLAALAAAMLPGAMAASVPSGQRHVSMIVEIGGSSETYFVLQDVSSSVNITASGDKSGWVSFGGSGKAVIHPSLAAILPVRISAPSDAQLGSYSIAILAGDAEIAGIEVSTTLQRSAIESLQSEVRRLTGLADVNSGISIVNSRLDSIDEKINSTGAGIAELAELQAEMKSVQDEASAISANVSAKVDEIRAASQDNGITGSLLSGAPVGMALGFVVGAVLIFAISNKRFLKKPY